MGNCLLLPFAKKEKANLYEDSKTDEDKTNSIMGTPPKGPLKSIYIQDSRADIMKSPVMRENKKTSIDDFLLLKVLGRGSFGKVLLVEKRDTKILYAMKILKKQTIAQRNQRIHTQNEREILQNIQSPFLVQLHYAFQTDSKLYLVMDFVQGGELFFHLRKSTTFKEARAKLYTAELILALEHLHAKNIVYRDLKPENILLDDKGHIKLTDFGLSKLGLDDAGKTYTFCGTPEYLAPEILQGKGHDKAVDWWSLGSLLYEMIDGAPPFYNRDRKQMFRNIIEKPVDLRSNFSQDLRSLLRGLLCQNPQKRLGASAEDSKEIKAHPFFKDIDWDAIYQKKIEPPFKPKLTHAKDLRHFDKMFTNEAAKDSPAVNLGEQKFSDHYVNFTYGSQLERDQKKQEDEDLLLENPNFVLA